MPWLVLESNTLWISRGKKIIGVKRLPDQLVMKNPQHLLPKAHTEDISKFVKVDDNIYSGGK